MSDSEKNMKQSNACIKKTAKSSLVLIATIYLKRHQKNDENSLVLAAKMYVYEGIKRIAANSWVQIAKICLRKH